MDDAKWREWVEEIVEWIARGEEEPMPTDELREAAREIVAMAIGWPSIAQEDIDDNVHGIATTVAMAESILARLVAAAEEREREACALFVEGFTSGSVYEIADRIRARGKR